MVKLAVLLGVAAALVIASSAGAVDRPLNVVTTVSPIRTGALKREVALMKIVPGPGISMPSTVEI